MRIAFITLQKKIAIRHPPSAIRHPPSAIRHPPSAICINPFKSAIFALYILRNGNCG
ncbi:MAG: hypothetical protein LCH54_10895 [Bacteroidetes bacterium]|nr:hypothetical protein [Bacteroidota bacterium]